MLLFCSGDGVADDTAAIQAAITAGGQNATIIYPAGTYLITSAITVQPQQHHVGYGAIISVASNISAFTRTADGFPGRIRFSNLRFKEPLILVVQSLLQIIPPL